METKHNPITVNIQVMYDYDASSRNFEENFKASPLFSNNNRGCNVFQYLDYGNIELIDDVKELFTIKTKSRHILYKFIDWLDKDECKDYTVEELHEEILNYYNFTDLAEFAKNETDNIKIKCHYILQETRGYSQGDCAYALIPTDVLRKVWGKNDESNEELVPKEYIDNLFWDAPIWGRIEIIAKQGQNYEFNLYDVPDIPEYLNYPQDIDFINEKILNFIKKEFKYAPALENILNAIKQALPKEISHPRYCY